MADLIFPTKLTDDLREILGKPNFVCGPMAHLFQAAGYDIPTKAEEEQAFILHWLVTLYLEHGEDWRLHAGKELKRVGELAKAAAEQASPERNTDG